MLPTSSTDALQNVPLHIHCLRYLTDSVSHTCSHTIHCDHCIHATACTIYITQQPETLAALSQQIPPPFTPSAERTTAISAYLNTATPETVTQWVEYSEVGTSVFKKGQQLVNFVTRALPLLGLYLVWVWVQSCIGHIAVKATGIKK
jgi:hypothetical protein